MSRLANKHSTAQSITYSDFLGGLNLSKPSYAIDDNQLSVAENVEYNSIDGSICKCTGLVRLYTHEANIDKLCVVNNDNFFFVSNNIAYHTDFNTTTKIGTLDGNEKPFIVEFNNKYYFCNGGSLYEYSWTNNNITSGKWLKIEGAPSNNDFIFVNNSRLASTTKRSMIITFSGINDGTNWAEDTKDDSASKWIQTGENNGDKLVACKTLYSDLIIFSNKNKAYRLIGEYPNWQVKQLANDVYCSNFNSCIQAMNSLFYIGKLGLRAIQTTNMYGDMISVDVGSAINDFLTRYLIEDEASIFVIPIKRQIWIQFGKVGIIFIYSLSNNAFTTRLSDNINDAVECDERTYIVRGNGVFELKKGVYTDDDKEITSTIKLKQIGLHHRILLKRSSVDCYSDVGGTGFISIDKAIFPLNNNNNKLVALNKTLVALNTDKVQLEYVININKRSNYKVGIFEPTFILDIGNIIIKRVQFDIAEVM